MPFPMTPMVFTVFTTASTRASSKLPWVNRIMSCEIPCWRDLDTQFLTAHLHSGLDLLLHCCAVTTKTQQRLQRHMAVDQRLRLIPQLLSRIGIIRLEVTALQQRPVNVVQVGNIR